MSIFPYLLLIFAITLIGGVATIMVGLSKPNKEGNPSYDKKTKGNWSRLFLFYLVAIVLGFAALAWYLYQM